MSKIGVDIDDVLFPWADTAHMLCERAGITNGRMYDSWQMWESYGCTKKDWLNAVKGMVLDGYYVTRHPMPGALESMERLKQAGHTIHLVTARGKFALGAQIRTATIEWLDKFQVPHDTLTFSPDKTVLPTDFFIEDNVDNYDALWAAGTQTVLVNRPHNACDDPPPRWRADNIADATDQVLYFASL